MTQDLEPTRSSQQSPQVGFSSAQVSWPQTITHTASAALATFTAAKLVNWLPTTLDYLRTPQGTISHDPWAWAPLALALSAIVAVASPVSFANGLALAKSLPFLSKLSEPGTRQAQTKDPTP
jgi:hypothetical protein